MKPKSPPATRGEQDTYSRPSRRHQKKERGKKEKRERDCSNRVGLYRPAEQSSKNDRKRRKGKGRDENGEEERERETSTRETQKEVERVSVEEYSKVVVRQREGKEKGRKRNPEKIRSTQIK